MSCGDLYKKITNHTPFPSKNYRKCSNKGNTQITTNKTYTNAVAASNKYSDN